MGKFILLLCILLIPFNLFSQTAQNRSIYIEGTAQNTEQRDFFLENFRMEGESLGYNIVTVRANAGYVLRFNVVPNVITYSDGTTEPAPPEEGRYIVFLSLLRGSDNFELSNIGFAFTELSEMYAYNQYLFFRSVISIPPPEAAPAAARDINLNWQNYFLYFRVAINYPIRFYILQQSTDLIGGIGVYDGTFLNPTRVAPMDHKFLALPGLSLGVEFQVLDLLSIEPVFNVFLGDFSEQMYLNMEAGALVKYNIKGFNDLVISPYGAFMYSLTESEDFADFPKMSAGAGVMFAFRTGESGSFIFDIGYMYRLGLINAHNPHRNLFPNPPTIGYQNHTISIGLGYRHGFFLRR